jgi:hypothetical protein
MHPGPSYYPYSPECVEALSERVAALEKTAEERLSALFTLLRRIRGS